MREMIEHLTLPPAASTAGAIQSATPGAAKTLDPNFEQRFTNTWFRGIVKAGIETIRETERVGEDGAKAMFWSAVTRALGDHLRREAEISFDFDRVVSPEEEAQLRERYGDDFDEIRF